MDEVLLSLHVVAAIIFVGPITVSSSLFPRFARQSLTDDALDHATTVARLLHRVTRVYAAFAFTVPAVGIVLAMRMGVLTDPWVVVSLALTAAAAVVLAAVIVPSQAKLLATVDGAADHRPPATVLADLKTLSMVSGTFALLWVIVTVMMIVRPGSTTGV